MSEQKRPLIQIIIRVPKNESAFTYFQLESNEGLAFYSTLPAPPHAAYCDLQLTTDLSLEKELRHLLDQLNKRFKVEILADIMTEDKTGD